VPGPVDLCEGGLHKASTPWRTASGTRPRLVPILQTAVARGGGVSAWCRYSGQRIIGIMLSWCPAVLMVSGVQHLALHSALQVLACHTPGAAALARPLQP